MSNTKKPAFDHIAIIYNPISTGDAPAMAERLRDRIRQSKDVIGHEATLTPTEHAGHALELAEHIATKHKRPLIISVSGDGGYNEVVNGAMRAKTKLSTAKPVVAVVGAGNANDHRRVVRDDDTSLVTLIKEASPKPLDLLKMEVKAKDYSLTHYAHSYIGFGISPYVAVELNRNELNLFQELKIIITSFMKYKPFIVEYKNKQRNLDSLLFANINEMGKVLKLEEKASIHDGKFEVIEFPHAGKLKLLYIMAIAALRGLRNNAQYREYSFKTVVGHPVQLDGEVEKIPKEATVTIYSVKDAIETLY